LAEAYKAAYVAAMVAHLVNKARTIALAVRATKLKANEAVETGVEEVRARFNPTPMNA